MRPIEARKTAPKSAPSMQLRVQTDPRFVDVVLEDFDTFLVDHASCERKASAFALALVQHYPDEKELVREMIDELLELEAENISEERYRAVEIGRRYETDYFELGVRRHCTLPFVGAAT